MSGLKDLQSEVEAELIEVKTRLCAVGARTLHHVSPNPQFPVYDPEYINFSGGEFALSTLFAVNKKYESYRANDKLAYEITNTKISIYAANSQAAYDSLEDGRDSAEKKEYKKQNTERLRAAAKSDAMLLKTMIPRMLKKIDKHFKHQVEKVAKDLQKYAKEKHNIKLGWYFAVEGGIMMFEVEE